MKEASTPYSWELGCGFMELRCGFLEQRCGRVASLVTGVCREIGDTGEVGVGWRRIPDLMDTVTAARAR